jgi:hypothetical protein
MIIITKKQFASLIEVGDIVGFYNNSVFAVYSKLIRLFAKNKLRLDHVAWVTNIDNNIMIISESVLFTQNQKWYSTFKRLGGIQDRKYQLYEYDINSIFTFCTNTQRILYLIKQAKPLTTVQIKKSVQDINNAKKKNYKYSIILAILSEIVPKSLLQTKFKKYVLHSRGRFCSLFIAKILKNSEIITDEEFNKNPLPSPSQLLEYSCFKNRDGQAIMYQVQLK